MFTELAHININDDIKNRANEICTQMNIGIHRGMKRKKLLFYCLYHAYKQFGIIEDPKNIAEMIGLPNKEICKALSMFCGKVNSKMYLTPYDYIRKYHEELKLPSDMLIHINNIADEVFKIDTSLQDEYPQSVAGAIILYYMTINGIAVDKKEFSKMIGKSMVSISKLVKRVMFAHNS
jgi:transcription initiation factor TFIIIB Brf1 subunit/transcription initiation factor TFIIB